MLMSSTFLGRVREVHLSRDGYRFAHLEPLYQSTDHRTWREIPPPVNRVFPSRGLVFWHNAPAHLAKGSYWQFGIVEHPHYDGSERPEKYQVSSAEPMIEIIDLRGYEEKVIRRWLTETGLQLDTPPVASHVLFWVDEEFWVGPVRVTNTGRDLKIDANEDLTRLQRRRLPSSEASWLNLEHRRIVLNPRRDMGDPVGICNWMTDAQFASGLLRRLRKLDRDAFDRLKITYGVFDEYVKAMEQAGLIGHDLEIELGRRERLRDLRATIDKNASFLEEAVSVLYEIEGIPHELEKRKEAEYKRILEEQEERLKTELAERRQEIENLEKEIENKRLELKRLQDEIDSKNEELDLLASRFEDALAARLARLLETPQEAFAELALFHKVFAPSAPVARDCPPAQAEVTPNPSSSALRTTRIVEIRHLINALGSNLSIRGASPLMAQDLHAAFLSGLLPIVTGSKAFEALEAYAWTVTGGRLCWIPVSPATFEPRELLGRFDAASKRIIPHPGGVLDILIEAQGTDRLYLIVLEGVNRAPVESYLFPLLDIFSDASVGCPRRGIPLAPRSAVDPADPYRDHCRLSWQPNVLLAAIPVFGTTTLPLPEAILDYVVLIDSDRYEHVQGVVACVPNDDVMHSNLYEVAYHDWIGFRRAATENAGSDIPGLKQVSGSAHLHPNVARIYQAALSSGMEADAARKFVVTTWILPRLRSHNTQDALAYANSVSLSGTEAMEIVEMSRRLMG